MLTTNRGIAILEMLFALAIIVFIVAVMIPAYINHTTPARVLEGLRYTVPIQRDINKTFSQNGVVSHEKANEYHKQRPSENVHKIVVEPLTGRITVHYTEVAGDGTIELVPQLVPGQGVRWDCSGGTLSTRHRPADCR